MKNLYEHINELKAEFKKLYNQLNEYSLMDYFDIQNYVSFVKENNIKLEGNLVLESGILCTKSLSHVTLTFPLDRKQKWEGM